MNFLFTILMIMLLAAITGWSFVGITIYLLWWMIAGLVIGLIGRIFVPDTGGMGLGVTISAGISGALIGGLIANIFDWSRSAEILMVIALSALFVAGAAPAARRM